MPGSLPSRAHRGVRLAGLLLVCVCASAAAGENEPPSAARDLAWGEVLFHFYQEDYVPAITRILVADKRNEYAHHGDESALVLGGLYLSYGLHQQAGEIFTRLLEQSPYASARARAWYYLARIRHERGYHDEALAAVRKAEQDLPRTYRAGQVDLHARILLALGRYEDAVTVLESNNLPGIWQHYAWYNVGVAMIRSGRQDRGAEFLDRVGRAEAQSEEMRALRDRANLALGYASLAEEDAEAARDALNRVRLQGPFANRALLGAGWADSQAGNPGAALAPWQVLAGRDPLDAAVQESLLAVPYAYASLSAGQQAVSGYRVAINGYEQELGRLAAAAESVRSGGLTTALDGLRGDGAMGWAWELDRVPDTPLGRYLYPLLAGHEFQESYKNYRDLQDLDARLAVWQDSLAAYRDMLAARQARLESRLPAAAAALDATTLEALETRHAESAAELVRVREEQDVAALATVEEQAMLERLERAGALLERNPEHPMLREAEWRHRRLTGLVYWQMHASFPQRLREAEKASLQAGRALEESNARRADIEAALTEGARRLAPLSERIDGAERRVAALRGRTGQLLAAQRGELEALALAELALREARIHGYLGQARYALAASYDRSARAAPGDGS